MTCGEVHPPTRTVCILEGDHPTHQGWAHYPGQYVTWAVRRDKLGRRIGRNWWREYNCDLLFSADQAWLDAREEQAIGYATEEAAYAEEHPRPTLKAFLETNRGLSKGQVI